MSDPSPAIRFTSVFERLSDWLVRAPEDREQLFHQLRSAHERNLLDADAFSMMEGILRSYDRCVRDIMVPRAHMDVLFLDQGMDGLITTVINTHHSRFPVVSESNQDEVVGILLAKDLLKLYRYPDRAIRIKEMIRPPVFIPESKRLNDLLRQFRHNRLHLAIVVDEYGGTAGMVTIEDVLEQIVGDIADEYDSLESVHPILPDEHGDYRVQGLTEVGEFNEYFNTDWVTRDNATTVGGLVILHFNRVPRPGEMIDIEGFKFSILRADSRQIHLMRVQRIQVSNANTV